MMTRDTTSLFLLLYIVTLSGCQGGGSIYSNFHDVAELQVVQTLGYDRSGDTVTLSVSTGPGTEELPGVILRGSGESIPDAMSRLQEQSARQELFFAHVRFVVVGEEAARTGLRELLDWFERMPQTRLDVPLFVVEGGEAASLFREGEEGGELTSALLSIQRDTEKEGFSFCTTVGEAARFLSGRDWTLCCALLPSDTPGEEHSTVRENGFALLQEGSLTDFTGTETAVGLCLLMNETGSGSVILPDGQGGRVTVSLSGVRTDSDAAAGEGGAPELTVTLRCRAGLTDVDSSLWDEELLSGADSALADWALSRTADALRFLYRHGIGLPGTADPKPMDTVIKVSARVERSYDLSAAGNLHREAAP